MLEAQSQQLQWCPKHRDEGAPKMMSYPKLAKVQVGGRRLQEEAEAEVRALPACQVGIRRKNAFRSPRARVLSQVLPWQPLEAQPWVGLDSLVVESKAPCLRRR